MGPVVERLRTAGRLAQVAVLPGVYFEAVSGGSENLDLALYAVDEG